MKDLLAGIVRQLVDIKAALSLVPSSRWATVTQASPLRITLDGDTSALADSPFCLIPKPKVGDRVSVIVANRRATIIGVPGGGKLFIPPGIITEFAGESPPPGWLICDGRQVKIADYPDLHAAIGHRYGGSGSYFAVPDLRGRVPAGLNPTNPAFNHLGKIGGSQTHTLTVAEMPSHTHPLTKKPAGPAKWDSTPAQVGGTDYSQTFWTGSHVGATGGNQPHNNLQPYITLNFIIKT